MPSNKTFERGGLRYEVEWLGDPQPDVSYLCGMDYSGCERAEIERYEAQDRERLAAFRRGDWQMLDCAVRISIDTDTRWAFGTVIGRAYLGGIESDSHPDHIRDVEEELTHEALEDARATLAAMAAVPVLQGPGPVADDRQMELSWTEVPA